MTKLFNKEGKEVALLKNDMTIEFKESVTGDIYLFNKEGKEISIKNEDGKMIVAFDPSYFQKQTLSDENISFKGNRMNIKE